MISLTRLSHQVTHSGKLDYEEFKSLGVHVWKCIVSKWNLLLLSPSAAYRGVNRKSKHEMLPYQKQTNYCEK